METLKCWIKILTICSYVILDPQKVANANLSGSATPATRTHHPAANKKTQITKRKIKDPQISPSKTLLQNPSKIPEKKDKKSFKHYQKSSKQSIKILEKNHENSLNSTKKNFKNHEKFVKKSIKITSFNRARAGPKCRSCLAALRVLLRRGNA